MTRGKLVILCITCFFSFKLNAQDITDALRHSSQSLEGTARYRSMSGAFGALGGDLSSIYSNPAGSAVFTYGEATGTLSWYNVKNNANFFGTTTSDSEDRFDLGQIGSVYIWENLRSKNIQKISMALTMENGANYENDLFIQGFNPNNGIDSYFLSYAQGVPLNLLQLQVGETIDGLYRFLGENESFGAQQAFLGYQGYILNEVINNPNNTAYVSNASFGPEGLDQQYFQGSSGYNRIFTLNFGLQLFDNLYLGANLNSHISEYRKYTFLSEIGFDENSLITETQFENWLYTYGTGFSFSLGGIYKITPGLRLGFSYLSPTWHRYNDELTQRLITYHFEVLGDGTITNDEVREVIDPRVINIYPTYNFRTPDRFTGSLAYVFGEKGLLSADFIYRNYGNSKFKPSSDSFFQSRNQEIEALLDGAWDVRLGGEYRLGDLSLRTGYRMEQSPYKDGRTVNDLIGYSFGAGYTWGPIFCDFSYDHASRDLFYSLYQVGLTDKAKVTQKLNNYILTLGIRF